jgi:PTH2 family peptidyl-tRNA hydrolase
VNTHKQIIVIRKDLKMRRGKECAQGAHASLGAILNLSQRDITSDQTEIVIPLDERTRPWLLGNFKKICVSVDSEQELLQLEQLAQSHNVINCKITDSGLTEFNGVPTITALAIGPDAAEKIDAIAGHLKLL